MKDSVPALEHVDRGWNSTPRVLRPFVAGIFPLGPGFGPGVVFPNGACDAVFGLRYTPHGSAAVGRVPKTLLHASLKSPVRPPRGAFTGICVRFRPGGFFPFSRSPAREVTGVRSLSDLVDARALEDELAGVEALAERIAAIETWLLDHFQPSRVSAGLSDLLSATDDGSGHGTAIPSPGVLRRRLGISERGLERLAARFIGLSPRRLFVVDRVNRTLRLARDSGWPWAEVAAEAGYADQSHMIRQVRRVTGMTAVEALASIRSGRAYLRE